jgi:hypothetical protein
MLKRIIIPFNFNNTLILSLKVNNIIYNAFFSQMRIIIFLKYLILRKVRFYNDQTYLTKKEIIIALMVQ